MKKLLLISTAVICLTVGHAQTNVSGGIFSNTTWTKANSPYIVTDTVVVFPGVTLTIQPGVTVKFANNKKIEIRQAKLIAVGTATDSITFTSNSSSPTSGIYSGLYLNGGSMTSLFDYCNFYYADKGINHYLVQDTVIVKNSNFKFNKYGIKDDWQFYDLLSKIDSCNFTYNTIDGLFVIGVVTNCNISYNGNGIEGGGNGGLIKNCTITNNTNTGAFGSSVINCIIRYNGIGCYAPTDVRNSIIEYNDTAVYWGQIIDSCTIKHNNYGIIGGQNVMNLIENCLIDSNSVLGISINGTMNDTVINCQIGHSITGLEINEKSYITKNEIQNCSIGILLKNSQSSISCNKICNNTSYGLKYTLASNTNVANNNWCTIDSSSTQPLIYDAHNNLSLGIIYFMPLDTICSPNTPNHINEIPEPMSVLIFPNPFSSQTTLHTDNLLRNATLTVDNCFGQTVAQIKNISGQTVVLSRDNLASGLYFVRLTADNKVFVDKLVITDK